MIALVLLTALPSISRGQRSAFSVAIDAGTEMERYVRVLGLVGLAKNGQWTIRPLGPRELPSLASADHPWRRQLSDSQLITAKGGALIAPSISVVYNSSLPYGFNDGPVWAGKGLTTTVTAGAAAARGPVSLIVAPVAFLAQNADVRIADNGLTGSRRFADWTFPDDIDRPQRFGTSTYARIDPGESELRVEKFGIATGLSSRAEAWGPASDHPIILGNNAGGVPRLFAGTQHPVGWRGVRVHGRVIWGVLNESDYGADTGTSRRHFATGIVGTLGFARAPGLEFGGSRFFHTTWPAGGLADVPWLRVLQAFIRSARSVGYNTDNQLAAAFFRLAPPGRGFELYGEFGREDRNASFRDLALEPDHIGAYLLGFARAWKSPSADRITVVRSEILNTRISHLQEKREQTPWYTHSSQREGHTLRGQALGSEGGFGGGASVFAVDRYTPRGRTTLRWDRIARASRLSVDGLPLAGSLDVTHAISLERAVFTPRGELAAEAALMKELNRDFAGDAYNAHLTLTYRLRR